jgi:hypothetical protein
VCLFCLSVCFSPSRAVIPSSLICCNAISFARPRRAKFPTHSSRFMRHPCSRKYFFFIISIESSQRFHSGRFPFSSCCLFLFVFLISHSHSLFLLVVGLENYQKWQKRENCFYQELLERWWWCDVKKGMSEFFWVGGNFWQKELPRRN